MSVEMSIGDCFLPVSTIEATFPHWSGPDIKGKAANVHFIDVENRLNYQRPWP